MCILRACDVYTVHTLSSSDENNNFAIIENIRRYYFLTLHLSDVVNVMEILDVSTSICVKVVVVMYDETQQMYASNCADVRFCVKVHG